MYNLLENKNIYLIIVCFLLSINNVFAFNEFQTFIEQKSKKQLNCAYCHSHPNGPEGNEEGQLGVLNEDKKKLTAYNQFLQSNKDFTDSPILNEFGNYLVKQLGYETIVNAQNEPDILTNKLQNSDLDMDGISDSQELLDGTLPNDSLDGDPFKLFISNLKKKWTGITFQVITIFLLILSLFKLKPYL